MKLIEWSFFKNIYIYILSFLSALNPFFFSLSVREAETSLQCLIYWAGSLAAVTGTGGALQCILSAQWTTSI